jgi:hypothetical protein
MFIAKRFAIPAMLAAGLCAVAVSANAAPPTTPSRATATRQPFSMPSLTRSPTSAITPANPFIGGVTQPYNKYTNAGISPANTFIGGVTQPYNRYTNAGISPANTFIGGVSQPYNQYHCVPNVGLVGANGVCP